MKKIMRAILMVAALGLVSFFAVYISSNNMGVFNPKGIMALAERNLIITATLLMLIVVIPVFILLAVFAWRYRASNTKAKYTPDWQSNKALEIIWWTIPTIIIITLGTITWKSSHDLDPFKPLLSNVQPITIQVVALDWKWLFIYPEQNIATVNFVQFPKYTPVNFRITADAPMNSFWIPQLAGQIYAMAGMDTKLHIMAIGEGEYAGLSANYSGAGFSGMKFVAKASSQEEFDQWVQQVRQSPNTLSLYEYNKLAEKSKNNVVAYYSSAEDGLYGKIIMKFMAPTKASPSLSEPTAMPEMGMQSNI
ncbi:MAG: ubiquinol oxidase subunit II [Candidatus Yonathbacteria bacterium RIFCSPHIGHO2_01_FULL_44_41]|uniref:Ubiquinol oxidase polypeptide II n=1 Tax=Candidatus Yonathbacteria bacterium RIFCSPHIGHO2_02_FULL_44_14 TaxID=1802724 RepID=A0A1G2S5W0_9BACT|nr:MAG: ubiquinol oxidase subunit II [Candidatus Yonathbacteria bacterium RIFCSPHIGHO2_01_FULL_44_41]OHA80514.1 MAG: ubiquinol oxidase subunit II [Candidatus Yonathbacteria bacterium RIFCSPHIGHO2_02_FULL_44_14]OHA82195.1 MAG: ubiquinol oxidase subunit II [Candidatus Yonathbacteria bacterium RIFCSPLOWO2_01_FULL_43_20]